MLTRRRVFGNACQNSNRPATVCRCARASVRLVSSLKGGGEAPSGLAKRLCVPPAQGFGAFPCVCHRPKGRLGFSGGVLPSSGQLSPSPVSVSPSGAPCPRPVLLSLPLVVSVSLLSWPLSRFPRCSPLFAVPVRLSSSPSVSAVPVRLASVQLTPSAVSCLLTCRPLVPCPVLFRLPVPLFLSPVQRRQSPSLNGTDLLCKWMCLRLRLFALILYFIPPTDPIWLSWPRIRKRRCHFLRTS